MSTGDRPKIGWPAWLGLAAVLLFDVWLRGHTFGPTLRERFGVNLYPVTARASEPLDCDEAIYAYIGKRIVGGDVMYRDLTENKPPGGYWLYALAVGIGGADELTVRLMPIPLVLATIAIVWWLGLRLRGPGAAFVAALTYAVLSTDPFLYANGANMEHMLNLPAVAALALVVASWGRPGRMLLVLAGACLGMAALVKQVAGLNAVVFAGALWLRRSVGSDPRGRSARVADVFAFLGGALAVWALAAGVVVAQGAGRDAFEDIFRYGPALATDTPPDPKAPPFLLRWFTGNADPGGRLPPPFGDTKYLVWWGNGSWPTWLAAVPALGWLLLARGSSPTRRLVAAWTLSVWVQVAAPRLFWAHYYLLPAPGIAVVVAVFLFDPPRWPRAGRLVPWLATIATSLALLWTAKIQAIEYLGTTPEELTIRDKGGTQWVVLRRMGREIGRRVAGWPHPSLYVWGWQSPLFFYSGLDGVSRQLFADDLIKSFAGGDHPLIRPRIDRTMADLKAHPPSLIFTGYPPFPRLRLFLNEGYLPSTTFPGLWVERSRYAEFEAGRPPEAMTR